MELSDLRALVILRDTCSLAKTGEHLHLSSAAVFSKIRQLEDEVGHKLYERIGRRLQLTNTGWLLAQHADPLLRAHDRLLSTVRHQGDCVRSLLRIGSGPHCSGRIVPELLRRFLDEHPNTEFQIETSDDQSLLRDLRNGLLDVVLMSLPVNDAELIEQPLWRYEMVLILPPPGRIPDGIALQDQPFLLYRRGIIVEAAVRAHCRAAGFEPQVVMENDEADAIRAMVQLGIGISVLPYWMVGEDSAAGRLRVVRLADPDFRLWGVLSRRTEYQSPIVDAFVAVAQQWQHWWSLAPYVTSLA